MSIKYLSIEHHSVCNLKCSYCSETYYGGLRATYDVRALVEDLRSEGSLATCEAVVWGGGEPTIGEDFSTIIDGLVRDLPEANHRVLTNAVKHSNTVEKLLADGRITVTTSVDAGTAETFERVRGRPMLRQLLANLSRYASVNPHLVTIKYIFTEDNRGIDDVRGFVHLLGEFGLTRCSVQISSDFKQKAISGEAAISMVLMYGLLVETGCEVVFFDDLLRQRLGDLGSCAEDEIRATLARAGVSHALADPNTTPSVVIWGAGWLAKYLLEKSKFFMRADVAFFVDSTPTKIGTCFMGREIHSPSVLLKSEMPVAIAACQSYPIIYRKYRELGLSPDRLLRKLIL